MSESTRPGLLAPYTPLDEPLLAFSSVDPSLVDSHPQKGLATHGPYSKNSLASGTDRIRVAIVGPECGREGRKRVLQNVQCAQQPMDRKDYVPPYPGFKELLDVPLMPGDQYRSAHLASGPRRTRIGIAGRTGFVVPSPNECDSLLRYVTSLILQSSICPIAGTQGYMAKDSMRMTKLKPLGLNWPSQHRSSMTVHSTFGTWPLSHGV